MNISSGVSIKRFASCTGFAILLFTFGAILGTIRRAAIDDAKFQVRGASWRGALKLKEAIKPAIQSESFAFRRLLEDPNDDDNCTDRGISSFPTLFTNEQRLNGAIIINILIATYLCGVIGYICSAYFVPSLEVISERLGLQPDVAGATFMAAGSSAPEFFSAVIGTFISEDDTGLSAVVGSAAFNVFIIIALVSFFSGRVVHLTWWPLIRDCICYVIGILLLVFVMYDSIIVWWEGLILALMYIAYIVLMYFNPVLSHKASQWSEKRKKKDDESNLIVEDTQAQIGYGTSENGTLSNSNDTSLPYNPPVADHSTSFSLPVGSNGITTSRKRNDSEISEHPERLDKRVVLSPPSGTLSCLLWVLGFPAILLIYFTIPDCRRKGCWRECYLLTFALSTVWLAFTSYALYWMIVVIGYTLNIPDTVMGITFLAAGTSVPDAIASVLVARDGFGDMAISNIIGSNIFEIFVCLGFLWFLKAVIDEPTVIASDGLTFTALALLFTVAFIILLIHFNGWKLDGLMGIICTLTYSIFIVIAILRELGIIGDVELPEYCPGPE
ncbi:sodium/potassium/calcium exchanger 3-like [Anneissia japonica]|uniref:sodium/potassium/calcium exchanger 3-like n=1 Tax=Anneissia japonica TaxID=1529436 RepID=UPI001425837F|nr:sodium/potassium/calcium exchanger 3-like [Anneissia japonica]XP_033107466.1 sodium/potassium/calcium exchanger 3-like [Anneissia japonica]